jgi:hypothetical protein
MQSQSKLVVDGRQHSTDTCLRCACCDSPASRFRPLVLTNKGWVCAMGTFCRTGTDAAVPR